MNSLSLLKRYHKEVDPRILAEYKDPPKRIFVNTDDTYRGKKTDKDLDPIEIALPDPPDPHEIDNFGLPAREQLWHVPKLPKRLAELQKKCKTLDEIWFEIDNHQDIYEEEIKFIRREWKRRLYGYWFYNNGVPTYIDGWHYFYIAWWNIDTGLPKYRDRDRRFFLFARKIYNETKSPLVDKEGNAIRNADGSYTWIDNERRIFYGFNYAKHRREGATYKAECINYEIISRTNGAFGGIQSMNDVQAKKCFLRHLVAPWKKLPFFFKPKYEGSTSPKTELSFAPPAIKLSTSGSLASSDFGLESGINFEMADPSAYDGDKLFFHHDDEVGKLKKGLSCWDRHTVVKECLVMGSEIIGYTIKTSTVGEMEKGGGKVFKHQCMMSKFYVRNPNGQTHSGLANLFIPAYDGLQGFIDKYGMSVIETPTKEQAEYIGRKIGAREYLMGKRQGLIKAGKQEDLSEEIRLYPIRFAECFRTNAKVSGFNMFKLESMIDELSLEKLPIVTGNFRWKNNIPDGKVEFYATSNGKFKVSHQLNADEANKKRWDEFEGTYKPLNTHWGVAGGDPFKFDKTKSPEYRKSKGAGAVVRKAFIRDGDFSMKRKFVCTYANRTYKKDEYGEDMLMMCVYYGVKMFPEIDVSFIWDYFVARGYGGFLLYKIDPKTYEREVTPGGTSNRMAQPIFTEYMDWIENEADIENHIEVLEECRDIDGPEDMTHHDLFVAGGYALMGTHGIYDEVQELDEQEYTLDNYFKKHPCR